MRKIITAIFFVMITFSSAHADICSYKMNEMGDAFDVEGCSAEQIIEINEEMEKAKQDVIWDFYPAKIQIGLKKDGTVVWREVEY